MKNPNIVAPEVTDKDAKIVECGERLVNLRDFSEDIVIEMEEISRKMQNLGDGVCFVRERVAKRLVKANSLLPKGLRLKMVDGFRPISAQKKIYRQLFSELKQKHPGWSNEELVSETDKWVANPSKTVPAHSTGGTVDLTIVDEKGRELDMGTPINTPDIKKAMTLSKSISAKAKKNRKLLIKVMIETGFANYAPEWWHWSYGDWRWAVANNRISMYGIYRKRSPRVK
jgi:zinc D-Ala-D-Ala dipeptidase